MVEYIRTFLENLASKPENKKIRELISRAVELHYNGMIHDLKKSGEIISLKYTAETAAEENTQKKRLTNLEDCYAQIRIFLLECGAEIPADNEEMYSKIIRPVFEHQIERSI